MEVLIVGIEGLSLVVLVTVVLMEVEELGRVAHLKHTIREIQTRWHEPEERALDRESLAMKLRTVLVIDYVTDSEVRNTVHTMLRRVAARERRQ